ncbi:hypothetical protein PUNSTDRAFT_130161 [Punctularia strigosozonata HHB-11173 SS5]|uniref:uncharacterized protein n=1 Tax=Punctularia strigosozonata (strain HHB-11173) TaxID=741275 RepID=UPI0004416A27|nr:uncharacterized protein PUNSTDRAFT_130161 [Punctularia strigosozonata HHB-11173 SS5]EIN14533.1 hypothetical protein PUNSTDRAFT_130161 [Punctularia strigosozonata HHB-11173 SS5]
MTPKTSPPPTAVGTPYGHPAPSPLAHAYHHVHDPDRDTSDADSLRTSYGFGPSPSASCASLTSLTTSASSHYSKSQSPLHTRSFVVKKPLPPTPTSAPPLAVPSSPSSTSLVSVFRMASLNCFRRSKSKAKERPKKEPATPEDTVRVDYPYIGAHLDRERSAVPPPPEHAYTHGLPDPHLPLPPHNAWGKARAHRAPATPEPLSPRREMPHSPLATLALEEEDHVHIYDSGHFYPRARHSRPVQLPSPALAVCEPPMRSRAAPLLPPRPPFAQHRPARRAVTKRVGSALRGVPAAGRPTSTTTAKTRDIQFSSTIAETCAVLMLHADADAAAAAATRASSDSADHPGHQHAPRVPQRARSSCCMRAAPFDWASFANAPCSHETGGQCPERRASSGTPNFDHYHRRHAPPSCCKSSLPHSTGIVLSFGYIYTYHK